MEIDSADILIADVTIINGGYAGRKTPNPNVMIELGYAIKSLGWDRIILLYDKDFGEIEELPFDINHRRITSFTLESCEEKAKMRDYRVCLQSEERDYQYVDVNLKDGNYTIIEGSMRGVPKG